MMEKLGVLAFIYYLQFGLSTAEITDHNGYCTVHYTAEEYLTETYKASTRSLKWVYEDGLYHQRSFLRYETRSHVVPKSVSRTRVECCAGYKNITVHEQIFSCEPICDPPCIQGHCTMPGNCTCFVGFEHQESNKCIPTCKPNCINGLCTSPGRCDCYDGYDKVNSSYCEPHCSQKCNNGVCHKPEECLCNIGYKKNPKDPFDCEPICDPACVNATCTSYSECTCWEGYGKMSMLSNECKPICDLECLNGDCTAPNTCTCHEGYSKNDSINVCSPICFNCTHGSCIKPNECECFENYTYSDKGHCEPICSNCSNGKCIAPYECECFEGYHQDNDGKCIPYCGSCENGKCIEPDVCSCFEGYESSGDSCSPICEYGCFAGECITPNNCSCQEYDRVEENVCFPLQQNGTNYTKNITLKRFLIDIMQKPNTSDIYDLYLSPIFIKINCSYKNVLYNTSSVYDTNSSSQNSIECSNIKNKHGLHVLCIWDTLNSEIKSMYTEWLPSVIDELHENETEKHYTKLGMTVFLPTDIMSEEENCYLCPSLKDFSTQMPDSFNIPFTPCEFKQWHDLTRIIGHTRSYILGLAILVAAFALITSLLVIIYRKYVTREYYVHSSQQTDQIALSLNQEDQ